MITRQINAQITVAISVVSLTLYCNLALMGAEPGVPGWILPDSACVLIFKGSVINKHRNQITAYSTSAPAHDKDQDSSNSIRVPLQSLGWRNRIGLPWAPIFGLPSPNSLIPAFLAEVDAIFISSTSRQI